MATKKDVFAALRGRDMRTFFEGLENMKWKGGLDAREDVAGRGDGPSIWEALWKEVITSEEFFYDAAIVRKIFECLLSLQEMEKAKKIIEYEVEKYADCADGTGRGTAWEFRARIRHRLTRESKDKENGGYVTELVPELVDFAMDVCEKRLSGIPGIHFFSLASEFSPERAFRYLKKNIERIDDETKFAMLVESLLDNETSNSVELLVSEGADINREFEVYSRFGTSKIWGKSVSEFLYEKRYDYTEEYSALLRAADKTGRLEELFAGDVYKLQDMFIFVAQHEPSLVKRMMELGADVNNIARNDDYNSTAIFNAAPESLPVLIEAGADVNFAVSEGTGSETETGCTPLCFTDGESVWSIHLLLAAGADVRRHILTADRYGGEMVFEKLLYSNSLDSDGSIPREVANRMRRKQIPIPYLITAKDEDFIDKFVKEPGGDEKRKKLLAETLNEYRERFMRMCASCEDHIPSLAKEIRDIGLGDGQYYFVDKLFCGLVLESDKNDYTNKLAEFMALAAKDGRLDTEDIFYRRAAYHIIGNIRDKTMREEYLGKVVEMAESMVREESSKAKFSVEETAKDLFEDCLKKVTANGAFPDTDGAVLCAREEAEKEFRRHLTEVVEKHGRAKGEENESVGNDYDGPVL